MGVASPLFTRTIEPSIAALVQDVRARSEATRSAEARAAAAPVPRAEAQAPAREAVR
jgi:hypothetical protein